MPIPVFVNAYRRAYALRERALRAADAGLYDAAAFYMRKIIEVIADSFVERYRELGRGAEFEIFCRRNGRSTYSLNEKVDFLCSQENIPAASRDAYDAVRTYGNAAVHKTDFREDPRQHAELMRRLDAELTSFYRMAMGD